MGLDFTSIKDEDGAAVYVLHNPSVTESRRFEQLKIDIVALKPTAQVELLDASRPEGEKVRDFYDFMPETLPVVFVIADDDTILYQWQSSEIPAADVICHYLSQTNG